MTTATFTHTVDDLLEAARAMRRAAWGMPELRPFFTRMGIFTAGCLFGIASAGYLAARVHLGWAWAVVPFALPLAILLYGLTGAADLKKVRLRLEADPTIGTPATLSWDERAFRFDMPLWEARVEWPAVRRVVHTRSMLVLLTQDTAWAIPRRAFASADEINAFLRHAGLGAGEPV